MGLGDHCGSLDREPFVKMIDSDLFICVEATTDDAMLDRDIGCHDRRQRSRDCKKDEGNTNTLARSHFDRNQRSVGLEN